MQFCHLSPTEMVLRSALSESAVPARAEQGACARRGRFRSLAAACLILLPVLSVRALNPSLDPIQYGCQTWTAQNGLPTNGVSAIAQGADGYIWIGAKRGLARFDGVEFTSVNLSTSRGVWNSNVRSLGPRREGGLWVGLENSGFGIYDHGRFSFQSRAEWGGAHIDVHNMFEGPDGTIWIAATNAAARLAPGGRFETVIGTLDDFVRAWSVAPGRQGNVWFGLVDGGVYEWRNGRTTKLDDPELDHLAVYAVQEAADGAMWLGTTNGLLGYDRQHRRIHTLLTGHHIRTVLIDAAGAVWSGGDDGLYRFHKGELRARHKDDGLAAGAVTALCIDRENTLWVGTQIGLSHLTDFKFPIYPMENDGLPHQVVAVTASSRGGVWATHDTGLSHVDQRVESVWPKPGDPPLTAKRIFETRNGDLYLTIREKTLMILSHGELRAKFEMPGMVVGLAEDREGVILSVGDALYRVNQAGYKLLPLPTPKPDFKWIVDIRVSRDGALWVATVNGVFRLKDGRADHWAAAEGLPDPRAVTLCEDFDGTMWVGLLSGIARLGGPKLRVADREAGLFDDDIYAIVPDRLGYLWVNSARGIFRLKRSEMIAFADGRTTTVHSEAFDGPDAMMSADKGTEERIGTTSTDGRIWFPTVNGAVSIDPAHVPRNLVPPLVHIDEVHANGKPLPPDGGSVAPGRGELQVQFTALSFVAPLKATFRYRLIGYDLGWVDAGHRRIAVYNNLKPGRYHFEAIAANSDGVESATAAGFDIEFKPHFFQTGWFRLSIAAVVGLFLAGLYRVRVEFLRRRERSLEENKRLLETEVQRRTTELADTNLALQQRTHALEAEIEERKRMQQEIQRVQKQLLEASRQAGMAEVATGVLHNVGNVLNSVNVSAAVLEQKLGASKIPSVSRVAALLEEHGGDLAAFLTNDPRGRQIPAFLNVLSNHLAEEQNSLAQELAALRRHLDHINEVVAMQQNYAKVIGVSETFSAVEVFEDALRVLAGSGGASAVAIVRELDCNPMLTTERHKVLQVLVNLVRNAREACERSGGSDRRIVVGTENVEDRIRFRVTDNGVGIPEADLTRLFAHGFTTRKNGHGFGLHSSALVARELGGMLTVNSDGPGRGATFVLEIPRVKTTAGATLVAAS
jgi:ligand-binding sensor domain-containing protein/signal transduction histidine kinase